ncbi:cupin domain-containing protein [Hymenobacter glacialis]|uniref:hypothetical protein n=1 Tax=Hymenobacter glacialis TaxID=1908236 RepID=UPI001300E15B|nr:hypothetical protein [Hymenobacter glacialis]
MTSNIASYNGIYGDSKALLSHDYLQSQLIVPRLRLTDWGLKPHLHENLFQLFFLEAGRPRLRRPKWWSWSRPAWSSFRPTPCTASRLARR